MPWFCVRQADPPPPPRRQTRSGGVPYRRCEFHSGGFSDLAIRTVPYNAGMDKRVEVRCTGEELARWKEAAGLIPLSRWIRLCCEARVDRRLPLRDIGENDGVAPAPLDAVGPRVGAELGRAAFRPDFKGGKR